MKAVAIIPARYDSSRLPGKVLKDICGKTMIERVYNQSKQAENIEQVIVATDDSRIFKAVEDFGGQVVMTGEHPTGTDRVAEAATKIEADVIINVQGDEPTLKPEMLEQLLKPFKQDKTLQMGTLKKKITQADKIKNPNIVKVICDNDDFALYFSRARIPYNRGESDIDYYKHIGIYAYRKDFLLEYTNLETTPLEKSESLEQLRALENGYQIKVVETDYEAFGVDTPEDLVEVREQFTVELENKELGTRY